MLSIVISLKSFYVLYFILAIPFIYYMIKDDKAYLLNKILKSPLFYFSILLSICVGLVYFFNTGCFWTVLLPKNSIDDTLSTGEFGTVTGAKPSLVYLKQNILSESIWIGLK